jgi:peptidoglycan hydrolase CwlO-like protein
MDVANVVTIVVAVIAAGSAYASQRAAARASTLNTSTSSRVDMEKEAYDRARKFDIETIQRQDEEIADLRADNEALHEKIDVARAEARQARSEVREMRIEKDKLRTRIAELEAEVHQQGPHS